MSCASRHLRVQDMASVLSLDLHKVEAKWAQVRPPFLSESKEETAID